MPKIRHIAIATNDPAATAEFYKKAFGFIEVGKTNESAKFADGYFLSDGTLNIAILKFRTDQIGKGMDYVGLHHFGVLVDDADQSANRLEALGAERVTGPASFFEVKFRGPDGVIIDIAQHPWVGSSPAEG
jgi:catechol 2,3-dioxygenase-like lactoylglutathione lyase family enzyme